LPENETIIYAPPVTLKAGQIQFVEACHSPLTAGQYAVNMRQEVKESQDAAAWNSNPYVSQMVFSVDAPRFTLNPADIHSVYPPVNESGRFDNALPHVVFTRRTLPWERTQDGIPPRFMEPFAPWIGLLLLQQEELQKVDQDGKPTGQNYEARPLPVFSKTADSLLSSSTGNVLVPDVGQNGPGDGKDQNKRMRAEEWEQERWRYETQGNNAQRGEEGSDLKSCLAIDLPAELFKAVAPRDVDLVYLAHVRQIDTGNKEVLGINDRGWFSLVMGNRLPEAKKTHRAFLISLEGLQDYLKDDWSPKPGQMVRVAVLGTWTFTCTESNDFKNLLDLVNLDREHAPAVGHREQLPDSWLRLPYKPFTDGDGGHIASPEDIVYGAYARGYTAFDHLMRQGERTVSWYRGPLVPLDYTKPRQIQEPVSCADELLRYDPETGLFDVAYAGAWQLGRLLALQNQSFALALNRTRRSLRARAESIMRESELKQLRKEAGLPDKKDTENNEFIEDSLLEHMANGAGERLKTAF